MLRLLNSRQNIRVPFELKGSLFTFTVLHLFNLDQEIIEQHLLEKTKQAPGFFNNTPVILDLEYLSSEQHINIDFKNLYCLLRKYGLIPVGIRNSNPAYVKAAMLAGIPVIAGKRPIHDSDRGHLRNLVYKQPVRSGQEIYAPGGDLIVLGTVSPGADIIADGNIHIYGALRGRALAGVQGDKKAYIFCRSLEAELVSITGHYRVYEQIDVTNLNKSVQIYLQQDQLIIEHLT